MAVHPVITVPHPSWVCNAAGMTKVVRCVAFRTAFMLR